MTADQNVVEATVLEEQKGKGLFLLFSVHRMDGSVLHYTTDGRFDEITGITGIDDDGEDFHLDVALIEDLGYTPGGVQAVTHNGEITVFPWHTVQLIQSTWQVIPDVS